MIVSLALTSLAALGMLPALTRDTTTRAPSMHAAARLAVTPETTLVDERVHLRATGLRPGARVVVRSSMRVRGAMLRAEAGFLADASGSVDLDAAAPVQGSYRGVDGMGLFWAMAPARATDVPSPADTAGAWAPPAPFAVHFQLLVDSAVVARASAVRRFIGDGVVMQRVDEPDVKAHLYLPVGSARLPLVIVLGGSEGGYDDLRASMLASRGFATMTIAYFGVPGTPAELFEVPVEVVERGLAWAARHPRIDSARVAIMGTSKGAELALVSASRIPGLCAVVANAPTDAVAQGIDRNGRSRATSSWTWRGQPLPFVRQVPPPEFESQFREHGPPYRLRILHEASRRDTASLHASQIAVEKVNGPILLLSGEDDQLGPSSEQAESIIARLKARGFRHSAEHLRFADAGHQILLPYLPTPPRNTAQFWAMGGTSEGYLRADVASWARTLEFLRASIADERRR
jgi:dienelactone hydrolase